MPDWIKPKKESAFDRADSARRAQEGEARYQALLDEIVTSEDVMAMKRREEEAEQEAEEREEREYRRKRAQIKEEEEAQERREQLERDREELRKAKARAATQTRPQPPLEAKTVPVPPAATAPKPTPEPTARTAPQTKPDAKPAEPTQPAPKGKPSVAAIPKPVPENAAEASTPKPSLLKEQAGAAPPVSPKEYLSSLRYADMEAKYAAGPRKATPDEVKEAWERAHGSKRIPVAKAIEEGIPSPPYNDVPGKAVVLQIRSQHSNSFPEKQTMVSEIRSKSTIVDFDGNTRRATFMNERLHWETKINGVPQPNPDLPRKTFSSALRTGAAEWDAYFNPKDSYLVSSSGFDFKPGRIRVGDQWERITETTKIVTTVTGFQIYNGYDCIVLSKEIGPQKNGPSDIRIRETEYFGYNIGVTVHSKSDQNLTMDLLSVEFPKP